MADKKSMALELVEESIAELESNKGSVATGIQKLSRAAKLIDKTDIVIWCDIVLANRYMTDFKKLFKLLVQSNDCKGKPEYEEINSQFKAQTKHITDNLGIPLTLASNPTINFMTEESSGGLNGIKFIEDKYLLLLKNKEGNDETYYQTNLKKHIEAIRAHALQLLHPLHEQLKFSGTTKNSFEILKTLIDDKILDLEPELAEQLMLAFKSVSSDNKEEWSQALTTCRRLLEGLADRLFPATNEQVNGRVLKQNQYVNRLWAFMDEAIESDSNKELAKTHVDLIGAWIQKINNLANKGVHAEVTQVEAIKMVFHTYLMLADILDYLDVSASVTQTKVSLSAASMDEFEAYLGVSRATVKEIIKMRAQNGGYLSFEQLALVKGIGVKTLQIAKESFIE
ncbi:helix-hairpin-helix domain-containing protein [Vitreoscilla massiliensis]|uniref:Helix-hairpin-helix domain-containing protein n=1 Tax=Vitreoscilla massiliensis TaxID=1689272 RepID=A0ABY4E6A3_9NEIS|nr:helix-hairpin-helix domain-containing protein [Vitreoscilla massiliensis]UOO90420.1 helix-hairpin-helix domain-containing protein [Vitreoscilla massiliensis]